MAENWLEEYRKQQEAEGKKGKEYLLGLLPLLRDAGAAKLVVYYDGSGDEGQVQFVHTFAKEEDEPHGKPNVTVNGLDENKIDEAACDVLSGLGIDWYNNEGGYGFVILTVSTGKVTVENNQRFERADYSQHEV